jgi:hypothetical protein
VGTDRSFAQRAFHSFLQFIVYYFSPPRLSGSHAGIKLKRKYAQIRERTRKTQDPGEPCDSEFQGFGLHYSIEIAASRSGIVRPVVGRRRFWKMVSSISSTLKTPWIATIVALILIWCLWSLELSPRTLSFVRSRVQLLWK